MSAPAVMIWIGLGMIVFGASGLIIQQVQIGFPISDSAAMAAGFVLVAGSVLMAGGILARRLTDLLYAAGVGD
ncbi:MAG: hypothetical protein ACTSX7_16475 [Alphaproteobacteria bacterium]